MEMNVHKLFLRQPKIKEEKDIENFDSCLYQNVTCYSFDSW